MLGLVSSGHRATRQPPNGDRAAALSVPHQHSDSHGCPCLSFSKNKELPSPFTYCPLFHLSFTIFDVRVSVSLCVSVSLWVSVCVCVHARTCLHTYTYDTLASSGGIYLAVGGKSPIDLKRIRSLGWLVHKGPACFCLCGAGVISVCLHA